MYQVCTDLSVPASGALNLAFIGPHFSSPQQQQQRHTHGCQISTLLYKLFAPAAFSRQRHLNLFICNNNNNNGEQSQRFPGGALRGGDKIPKYWYVVTYYIYFLLML